MDNLQIHRQNDIAITVCDRGEIKNYLSYGEVYQISDSITGFLSSHIQEKNQCVGLKMVHNIYIPSIILSLQKLQHPFIFLSGGETEIQFTVKNIGLPWILSFDKTKTCVAKLDLNEQKLVLEKTSYKPLKSYKDTFYIIKTSGTTGDAKFVKVSTTSIQSNIKCLSRIFNIQNSDVIYFGTSLTFDPSMIELLLALHNGACLLMTPKTHMNPDYLYQSLFHSKNGISVLQIVPSVFLRWSEAQIEQIILNAKLKILAFGGEKFPHFILNYKKSESLKIFNLYGITEISCWASICEIQPNQVDVSLGEALDDTIIEVRDDLGNKIEEGEGEVYIGSKDRICLVDNELKHQEYRATGDIAVINNRGIFYKGRKNDVFKRFGHKVHLSKIEEIVLKETNLANKCVWSKSESKLVLFLIIEDFDASVKNKILDKVRIKLLHSLPEQYFPDYTDIIRKCPVTSHGKTDIKTLESIYLNRNFQDQKSPADILRSLISKCLGLGEKQVKDFEQNNFFELGGNSILAIQLLSEFRDQTGVECPDFVTALFVKNIRACFECVNLVKSGRKRLNVPSNNHDTIKKIKTEIELKIGWSYDLQACVDSVPLVFSHNERIFVAIGSFSHIFVVLDAVSGVEISKFLLPDVVESSPCLSPCKNYLYVGCFDGCLYCLDFIENSIKWIYCTRDRIKCTPVGCQDLTAVVFGSYDKHVHCINGENGTLIWKTLVQESITSTPYVSQEKIYVATICGTCLCLHETTGDILWQYKTSSPIFGAPCPINDVIIWPEVQGKLLFMSTEGCKVQEFLCTGHLYSSLVAHEDMIIFGCHNHCLYVLKIRNDVPVVKVIANLGDILTTPYIYKNRIVVACSSGTLFLVDFDGNLMAELQLPGKVFSSVVVNEGRIFVGCRNNKLYCIKIME